MENKTACHSRKPLSHPDQHAEAELTRIRNMRRRNPNLGIVGLWARLRNRGHARRPESLWGALRRKGLAPHILPRARLTRLQRAEPHTDKPT